MKFRCIVWSAVLSVEACSKRHRTAGDDPTCKRCPTGAEHARGRMPARWPEAKGGALIERKLELVPARPRIPSRKKRRPAA